MDKKPKMDKKHLTTFWSLDLPSNWSAHDDVDVATFTPISEIGALQISCYEKNREVVTLKDLIDFASDFVGGSKRKNVSFNGFSGFCVSYIEGNTFWKKWWLRSKSIMLYITFNVDSDKAGGEIDNVEAIMSTLRPKS